MLKNSSSPFFAELIARGYVEHDSAPNADGKSGYRLTAKALAKVENLSLAKQLDNLLREGTREDEPDFALLELPLRFALGA
jgi:hypothetical protein